MNGSPKCPDKEGPATGGIVGLLEREKIYPFGGASVESTKCNTVTLDLQLRCGCGQVVTEAIPDIDAYEDTSLWEEELKQ
jgi:hypothetical protein